MDAAKNLFLDEDDEGYIHKLFLNEMVEPHQTHLCYRLSERPITDTVTVYERGIEYSGKKRKHKAVGRGDNH